MIVRCNPQSMDVIWERLEFQNPTNQRATIRCGLRRGQPMHVAVNDRPGPPCRMFNWRMAVNQQWFLKLIISKLALLDEKSNVERCVNEFNQSLPSAPDRCTTIESDHWISYFFGNEVPSYERNPERLGSSKSAMCVGVLQGTGRVVFGLSPSTYSCALSTMVFVEVGVWLPSSVSKQQHYADWQPLLFQHLGQTKNSNKLLWHRKQGKVQ